MQQTRARKGKNRQPKGVSRSVQQRAEELREVGVLRVCIREIRVYPLVRKLLSKLRTGLPSFRRGSRNDRQVCVNIVIEQAVRDEELEKQLLLERQLALLWGQG